MPARGDHGQLKQALAGAEEPPLGHRMRGLQCQAGAWALAGSLCMLCDLGQAAFPL